MQSLSANQKLDKNALTSIALGGSAEPSLPAAGFNRRYFGQIRRQLAGRKILNIHFHQAQKRGQPTSGFVSPLRSDNHAHRRGDTAMAADNINCFLHAPAARDDVFKTTNLWSGAIWKPRRKASLPWFNNSSISRKNTIDTVGGAGTLGKLFRELGPANSREE
jgi:hypothetical protein